MIVALSFATGQQRRAVLSEREAESIINQPDVTTPLGLRDRAMLEVLYSTGIRRLELIQLKVLDLDSERGTLLVRMGKGKKDRMIPIGERAILWTEKYLHEARPEIACGADEGILFLSKLGLALGKNRLTSLIRSYVDAAKIGKKGSCHLFRHTMATLMLENGAKPRRAKTKAILEEPEPTIDDLFTTLVAEEKDDPEEE